MTDTVLLGNACQGSRHYLFTIAFGIQSSSNQSSPQGTWRNMRFPNSYDGVVVVVGNT